jgi:hypothetical protein
VQPLGSFTAFYGTRRFIATYTRGHHLHLSCARPFHSILMLSIHLRLGLPSGLFSSGFSMNNPYTFLLSPIRFSCPAYLILLDLIILIILGEEYKSCSYSLWSFSTMYPIDGYHSPFHRKNVYSPAGTVPLPSHLTSCTPTKSSLYLDSSLETVIWESALYKLMFYVPNFMSISVA